VRSPIHERAAEFGVRGTGYSWSHNTMDWRGAVAAARRMYERIGNSALCGGYSLSLWGVFYLMAQGYSIEQQLAFMNTTRRMVLAGLDERESNDFPQLVSLFQS
jgi:hypothetical protein